MICAVFQDTLPCTDYKSRSVCFVSMLLTASAMFCYYSFRQPSWFLCFDVKSFDRRKFLQIHEYWPNPVFIIYNRFNTQAFDFYLLTCFILLSNRHKIDEAGVASKLSFVSLSEVIMMYGEEHLDKYNCVGMLIKSDIIRSNRRHQKFCAIRKRQLRTLQTIVSSC